MKSWWRRLGLHSAATSSVGSKQRAAAKVMRGQCVAGRGYRVAPTIVFRDVLAPGSWGWDVTATEDGKFAVEVYATKEDMPRALRATADRLEETK